MTNLDCLGNNITNASPQVIAGVNDFINGFLAYEKKAVNIIDVANKNPNSCIANAYASMLWMFLESPEAPDKAKPFLKRALESLGSANKREAEITRIMSD